MKRALGAVAGMTTAGVGSFLYGTRLETEWLDLQRVQIPIKGLPENLAGFRIAVLSDFHLYPDTRLEFIEEAVAEANKLNPDLAVFLGDFVQRTAEAMDDLAPALARLNAKHGLFAVMGNHDIWKGPQVVRSTLEKVGIPMLVNDGLTLSHQGTPFFLAGVDDTWSGRPDLDEAMKKHPAGTPVILLSHEPDPADSYSRDPRISVQLSGHSHGGQVRFPGIGSPFLPPHGRTYDMGLYRVRDMWLYTNRGIGVTVPIRINCRPEVTEVTLIQEG